ncbi:zinc ribbon domain-containing protein [Pectinatus cerevisiiphilus]|uniref:Zinc ribbon protein n=1 Tax=Pectinatus cerevisiiphilus TaxID=86956 RepID=A0A4R3KFI6_9FIRM|nr:zinc ribbon domain-containing protein [Pectinatus cerevisiiphilus]TCS81411.1 zinc ribbon protein [Pectinatus cerevisiiphilus]
MNATKCAACNREINMNSKFCPYCGANQTGVSNKTVIPSPTNTDVQESFEFVKLKKWLGVTRYGKSVTQIELNGNIMNIYQYQILDPFIKYGKKNWQIPISDIQDIFSEKKVNIIGIVMVILLIFFSRSDFRILLAIILVVPFLRSRKVSIRTGNTVIPFNVDLKDDSFKKFVEMLRYKNRNFKLNEMA